jgi:hypothetical protein
MRLPPLFALSILAGLLGAVPVQGAEEDPEWPCVQRKVPELSMGQIWTGPDLPESARKWQDDEEIAALVSAAAARKMPLDEAERQIGNFVEALPEDDRPQRSAMLVQALFDTMNAERSRVISAIGRYSRKQLELAELLRQDSSELTEMQERGDPEAVLRSEELAWGTRIYNEHMRSLTYVCEVPVLIEQRLYALARVIASQDSGGESRD